VPDLRPRGLARPEDEPVEELDREQDRDEAGGSAPAAREGLAGRPREAHVPIVHPFRGSRQGEKTGTEERGGMGKKIQDLMTKNPRTVTADATIAEAAKIMRDEDTGVVPIVDGDQLAAVITDRDIAIRAVAEG
jgi:CBS domain-containing protein